MSPLAKLFDSPRLLLGLCTLFWAGNFVLARAMHATIPPVGLAFWRWFAASLLVLPFVWPAMRRQWPLLRSRFWRLLLLAVLGVSGFNTLVYLGLQTTTATNSVLIQSTLPVQILLLNWLLFGAQAGPREFLSILVSLTGVLVIVSGGDPRQLWHGDWHTGDLWVLAAALAWVSSPVRL